MGELIEAFAAVKAVRLLTWRDVKVRLGNSRAPLKTKFFDRSCFQSSRSSLELFVVSSPICLRKFCHFSLYAMIACPRHLLSAFEHLPPLDPTSDDVVSEDLPPQVDDRAARLCVNFVQEVYLAHLQAEEERKCREWTSGWKNTWLRQLLLDKVAPGDVEIVRMLRVADALGCSLVARAVCERLLELALCGRAPALNPSVFSEAMTARTKAQHGGSDGEEEEEEEEESSGEEDGGESSGEEDGGESSGEESSGEEDGEESSGEEGGEESSGEEDGEESSGEEDGKESSGEEDGKESSGEEDGKESSDGGEGESEGGSMRGRKRKREKFSEGELQVRKKGTRPGLKSKVAPSLLVRELSLAFSSPSALNCALTVAWQGRTGLEDGFLPVEAHSEVDGQEHMDRVEWRQARVAVAACFFCLPDEEQTTALRDVRDRHVFAAATAFLRRERVDPSHLMTFLSKSERPRLEGVPTAVLWFLCEESGGRMPHPADLMLHAAEEDLESFRRPKHTIAGASPRPLVDACPRRSAKILAVLTRLVRGEADDEVHGALARLPEDLTEAELRTIRSGLVASRCSDSVVAHVVELTAAARFLPRDHSVQAELLKRGMFELLKITADPSADRILIKQRGGNGGAEALWRAATAFGEEGARFVEENVTFEREVGNWLMKKAVGAAGQRNEATVLNLLRLGLPTCWRGGCRTWDRTGVPCCPCSVLRRSGAPWPLGVMKRFGMLENMCEMALQECVVREFARAGMDELHSFRASFPDEVWARHAPFGMDFTPGLSPAEPFGEPGEHRPTDLQWLVRTFKLTNPLHVLREGVLAAFCASAVEALEFVVEARKGKPFEEAQRLLGRFLCRKRLDVASALVACAPNDEARRDLVWDRSVLFMSAQLDPTPLKLLMEMRLSWPVARGDSRRDFHRFDLARVATAHSRETMDMLKCFLGARAIWTEPGAALRAVKAGLLVELRAALESPFGFEMDVGSDVLVQLARGCKGREDAEETWTRDPPFPLPSPVARELVEGLLTGRWGHAPTPSPEALWACVEFSDEPMLKLFLWALTGSAHLSDPGLVSSAIAAGHPGVLSLLLECPTSSLPADPMKELCEAQWTWGGFSWAGNAMLAMATALERRGVAASPELLPCLLRGGHFRAATELMGREKLVLASDPRAVALEVLRSAFPIPHPLWKKLVAALPCLLPSWRRGTCCQASPEGACAIEWGAVAGEAGAAERGDPALCALRPPGGQAGDLLSEFETRGDIHDRPCACVKGFHASLSDRFSFEEDDFLPSTLCGCLRAKRSLPRA